MRIGIEDMISDDTDNVPLLEDINKHKESDCIYEANVITTKDTRDRNKLIVACILCLVFMVGEMVGGLLANSLAILTDSAHLFSDLSSFIVGLVAMFLVNRPSSKTMTFGWHRAEVLGALFSVLFIWVVTGVLVYTAILRIISRNFEINSSVMLIMSAIGVIINIIMALVLHPHSHSHDGHTHGHSHGPVSTDIPVNGYDSVTSPSSSPLESINTNGVKHRATKTKVQNINLRAAFIHVIGDIIQSFGVLVASFIIYFKPQWKIADPICTFIFSILVLITTVSVFADIVCVFLERKPRHLSYNTIYNRIQSLPGVSHLHHLRLWSITLNRTAASCHITLHDRGQSKQVLDKAHALLSEEFHISEITIQVESASSNSD